MKTLSKYLQEEMEARGWGDADIDSRVSDPVDQLAVYLAIYVDDEGLSLDIETAKILSMIFDVSSELFMGLSKNHGQQEVEL